MLTEKEIEVLKLKKKGFTQERIAKKLKISQPAISGFYNNALKKIRDAAEIIKLKKEMKLGQGAIEFVIIFGFALFFFIIFLGTIQLNITEKNYEKDKKVLQNVALSVRDEINIASESSGGYSREFDVPQNIFGRDYQISINESLVIVQMDEAFFSYKVANVTGNVRKGVNNITKQNEVVLLNV